ncbi:actin depolymerizing protein, partial [Atractiella rhizophila]
TGEGGLEEFKSKLDDSKGSYGYCRIEYANDEESKRSKFILVTWIGSNVKVMRKARMGVHISDVKQTLRQYSLDVAASSADDLQEDPIVVRLRKAGGA